MRYRKKPWADEEFATNKAIITNPNENKGKWSELFGNNNPIHIEIGCGKGQFLTEMSKRNPNINYIGIEREDRIIVTALKKSREAEVGDNIRFIVMDVVNINDVFATGEVGRIYINFCDPWHRRKKWAKRRLTHRNFLSLYEQLFGERGGEIFLKTDNVILFDFSLNEVADKGWRLHNISLDLHKSDFEGNVMTEYEQKFAALGQPIYRLEGYYNTLPEGIKDED
jgi:tRNA (guanine-N7-)-methyltransferase